MAQIFCLFIGGMLFGIGAWHTVHFALQYPIDKKRFEEGQEIYGEDYCRGEHVGVKYVNGREATMLGNLRSMKVSIFLVIIGILVIAIGL